MLLHILLLELKIKKVKLNKTINANNKNMILNKRIYQINTNFFLAI